MLVCGTCGIVNQDPGGDPRTYRCGNCGQPTLYRQLPARLPIGSAAPAGNNNNTLAGAVVGGALGGIAGGPVGAIFGIVIGGLVGNQVKPG
jgi:hypothetical protein